MGIRGELRAGRSLFITDAETVLTMIYGPGQTLVSASHYLFAAHALSATVSLVRQAVAVHPRPGRKPELHPPVEQPEQSMYRTSSCLMVYI